MANLNLQIQYTDSVLLFFDSKESIAEEIKAALATSLEPLEVSSDDQTTVDRVLHCIENGFAAFTRGKSSYLVVDVDPHETMPNCLVVKVCVPMMDFTKPVSH